MSRSLVRRRSVAAATAVVLAFSSVLSACSSDSSSDDDTYLIGFPALLSGAAAFAGAPLAQGAELAAEEINDTDFLGGSKVELKIDDLKSDPAVAISLYKQYAADGAAGVLCCGAAETGALAPLIMQSDVPAVITSANRIESVDGKRTFSTVLLPAAEGGMYDTFVDDMVAAEGYKTAVVAVNGDSEAMTKDSEVLTAALERNGVKVVETVNIAMADTNYTGPATKIAGTEADVVVSAMLGGSTAQLAKALRDRKYDNRILTSYGASGQALFETAGAAIAGVAFTTPFAADHPVGDDAKRFVELYTKKFDQEPDLFAAQGYTAMWAMAHALKDAGENSPEAVAKALANLKGIDSVYGPITFSGGQASFDSAGTYLEWTKDGNLVELPQG